MKVYPRLNHELLFDSNPILKLQIISELARYSIGKRMPAVFNRQILNLVRLMTSPLYYAEWYKDCFDPKRKRFNAAQLDWNRRLIYNPSSVMILELKYLSTQRDPDYSWMAYLYQSDAPQSQANQLHS